MKAIIIAGGKGERLRPLTNKIPKPMIKINGKPILEHTINLLKKHGIKDIVIALCYLPDKITSYFGDGSKFNVKISYIFEKSENPMGTAGAILPAHKLIRGTFIVTYADILRNLNINDMLKSHKNSNSLATINIYKHVGDNFKSSLKFNKRNILLKFLELNKSNKLKKKVTWSNGSLYIFEPEIFKYITKNKNMDFSKDVFPVLLKLNKKISVFQSNGFFLDIGTKKNLRRARKLIL